MKLALLITLISVELVFSKHWIIVGKQQYETHQNGNKEPECTDDAATTGIGSNHHGNHIGVQCCTMDGTSGYRQNIPGGDAGNNGCLQEVNYNTAKSACESNGDRLCTTQEVENDIASGTGCNHDARHVWTADSCSAHKIRVGDPNKSGNLEQEECSEDDDVRGSGWHTEDGNEIGVQCCSQDGTTGYRKNIPGGDPNDNGCLQGVAYDVAKSACNTNNDRLCTAQEIQNGIGKATGCKHDHKHIWTSTTCQPATAHKIVVGARDWLTHTTGDKQEECANNEATTGVASNSYGNDIGVQCCQQDGSSGYRQNIPGGDAGNSGCLQAVTYSVAKSRCEFNGDRLCTTQEVENDIGKGTGCNHNARHVWTSDVCSIPTPAPTDPTPDPTRSPTTRQPTTRSPTVNPTPSPTDPTPDPTRSPTTRQPTTRSPTVNPTPGPTDVTPDPTRSPTTRQPTSSPAGSGAQAYLHGADYGYDGVNDDKNNPRDISDFSDLKSMIIIGLCLLLIFGTVVMITIYKCCIKNKRNDYKKVNYMASDTEFDSEANLIS